MLGSNVGVFVIKIVEAVYVGAVPRPSIALGLEPNIRVRLTFEVLPTQAEPKSFLDTARTGSLWSRGLVGKPRQLSLWRRRSTPGMRCSWIPPTRLPCPRRPTSSTTNTSNNVASLPYSAKMMANWLPDNSQITTPESCSMSTSSTRCLLGVLDAM